MALELDVKKGKAEHKLDFKGHDEVKSLSLDTVFAHDNQGVVAMAFFQHDSPIAAGQTSGTQVDAESGLILLPTRCIGRYSMSYALAMKLIELLEGVTGAMREAAIAEFEAKRDAAEQEAVGADNV